MASPVLNAVLKGRENEEGGRVQRQGRGGGIMAKVKQGWLRQTCTARIRMGCY